MDIDALMNRKNELIELRDDEEHEFQGHEELELDELIELESDLGMTLEGAYQNGVQFIDRDYFEDYARELAEDVGAISSDLEWPATHIDWKSAAEELEMDYTEIEFDGNNYLVRV